MKQLFLTIAILANIAFSSCATTTLITTSSNRDGSAKEYRLQENSIDYKGAAITATTTSKVTTSSSNNKPEGTKYETVPLSIYVQNPVTTTTTVSEGHSGGYGVLEGYTGTGLPAPATFIRPEGSLPPVSFGSEGFPLYNANGAPNCGCVVRGSCSGRVGIFTTQVLKFSDIVCGHQFDTCCFDGPWAGTYDVYASAAACVPKEECRRPYGVLPTDVRDFGAIPPCPGLGAVRCILVDNAGFMEFQAAVAAIEAANNYNVHQRIETTKYEPMHFVVPVLSGSGLGGESTTSVETTSTLDVEASKTPALVEEVKVVPPVAVPCPPEREHQKTVVVVVAPPKIQTPAPIPIVEPVKTTHVTVISSPPEPQKVAPPPAVVQEVPVTPPVTPHHGVYGAYPSFIGAYPGYGLGYGAGAGFGFRKSIRISKGFGSGLGWFG